jgi:membrane-associated protease RseP (regulator of RpoE activity)
MNWRPIVHHASGFSLVAALLVAPIGFAATVVAAPLVQAGTPELMFDQGKRAFDTVAYDKAIPIFDAVLAALAASPQTPKPDLQAQTLELRARARYAVGDSAGAEQDFLALLTLKPGYKLPAGVSPRVVAVFDGVRRIAVGQVQLSLTPAGDVQIDGRTYALTPAPQVIDLTAGEHQVNATREGYRAIAQKFTVAANNIASLPLTLERVSATLTVVSIPDGVDVLFDGTSRGQTAAGADTSGASAPLLLTDLQTGTHRLQLRRDCYREVERTITIDRPDDLRTDPLRLMPAVATVKIQTSQPGASVYVDGSARGSAPLEITNLCEGSHLIEVKGSKGRYVDRRDWRMGDSATLTADLRSAFPIVSVHPASGQTADQLKTAVERALAPAKRAMVYAPAAVDLQNATRGDDVPAEWLIVDPNANAQAPPRVPRDLTRDLARRISGRMEVQGVTGISATSDPYVATVSLVAAGSSEPDVFTVNTADAASRARAVEMLSAPLPPLARPSIETSVVDVAGVKGAVVVRAAGVGATAGLAAGDVITSAGGTAVASAADLRAKIAAMAPPSMTLPLEVHNPAGTVRTITATVTMVPDAMPLRSADVLYNRALVELQNAAATVSTVAERASAHVNLAIVHMRLGNWDDAQAELKLAQLPDGPGVSAGTVSYLTGLCLEAAGRAAEARAAFTKAAASPLARLSTDGPLVAPLAQQKLR